MSFKLFILYCFPFLIYYIRGDNQCQNEQFCYLCKSGTCFSILPTQYDGTGTLYTLIDCLNKCSTSSTSSSNIANIQLPTLSWNFKQYGPCFNCTIFIYRSSNSTKSLFAFQDIFTSLKLTDTSLNSQNCDYNGTFLVSIPEEWNEYPIRSDMNISILGSNIDNYSILGRVLQIQINKKSLHSLVNDRQNLSMPILTIIGVSTTSYPSDALLSNIVFNFRSNNCLAIDNNPNVRQDFTLTLPFKNQNITVPSGKFNNFNLYVINPVINQTTALHIKMLSGTILKNTSWILIRSFYDNLFYYTFQSVAQAKLIEPYEMDLSVIIGTSNLSIFFPSQMNNIIDNGVSFHIMLDPVINPKKIDNTLNTLYFTAFTSNTIVIIDSPAPLYYIEEEKRKNGINMLDLVTSILYGLCILASLFIIRWHGLHFTHMTIWTDFMAINVVCSFIVGFTSYVLWLLSPSLAVVYLDAIQNIFVTLMIISLCFHWASVLSLKLFMKITLKSPVALVYLAMTSVVVVIGIVSVVTIHKRLKCAFNKVLSCDNIDNCSTVPPMNGAASRDASKHCHADGYYLTIASIFIFYTLLTMTLGCMVMGRGRTIMLANDLRNGGNENKIRKSLTIFYSIISTTCVLYISAQIILIVQYTSNGRDLQDAVWYLFVVWLPYCVPPLLLLFMQWNPATSETHITYESDLDCSHDVVMLQVSPNLSSALSSSGTLNYKQLEDKSKDLKDPNHKHEKIEDYCTTKLPLIVKLTLPNIFTRRCYITLEYCMTKAPLSAEDFSLLIKDVNWNNVGATEKVFPEVTKSEKLIVPFVAVLEIPFVAPASQTLLRFVLYHADEDEATLLGLSENAPYNRRLTEGTNETKFNPICEFVTSLQAILDASSNNHELSTSASEELTSSDLVNRSVALKNNIDLLLEGNVKNAVLSVQSLSLGADRSTTNSIIQEEHRNIGNITRYFQFDSENTVGGLVVEELKESKYAISIPRQLLELIAIEREQQVEEAKTDLSSFNSKKRVRLPSGFYANLIGQIKDEGDTARIRAWLQNRYQTRKEYVLFIRNNVQYLFNRERNRNYFKASIDKKDSESRFIPTNLHVADMLVGPTNAFVNNDKSSGKRRSSEKVAIYDTTTVGAMAAHIYNFGKGGVLSMQNRLEKLHEKIGEQNIRSDQWTEDIREYDDLKWDIQVRMDTCLCQALSTLVASFSHKVEIALQHSNSSKGEDILRRLSTLGYLFQVESLLSTHGKEIGMLEDMSAAISLLSSVSFILQDVNEKPVGRFSFRMPNSNRKKNGRKELPHVIKTQIRKKIKQKPKDDDVIKYQVVLSVSCGAVSLPERLANGGEILVTPVLFTQGINEMQTIANNTERGKTEIQDLINKTGLKILKSFCEKYTRLLVALPMSSLVSTNDINGAKVYLTTTQTNLKLNEQQVMLSLNSLESLINDAANSIVKTKRPEILANASDLCRELGGGRVTVCKSAKDRTAMSVTLEQGRILHRHHNLPLHKIPATVAVMRTHGVRIENAFKNTDYRCPESVAGSGNVS